MQQCNVDSEVCCQVKVPTPAPTPAPTRGTPPPTRASYIPPPPPPTPKRQLPTPCYNGNSVCAPANQCYNGAVSRGSPYASRAPVRFILTIQKENNTKKSHTLHISDPIQRNITNPLSN